MGFMTGGTTAAAAGVTNTISINHLTSIMPAAINFI
jgi:hypothetical protein